MKLRTFLYLNDDLVSGFLGSMVGGVPEGTIDTVTKGSRSGGASAKVGQFGSSLGADQQHEDRRGLRITDEARFQQLYEQLKSDPTGILRLHSFSNDIVAGLERGEVVEVEADILLNATLVTLASLGPQLVEAADAAQLLGMDMSLPNVDGGDALAAFGAISKLSKAISGTTMPIEFEALGNEEVSFGAVLERSFIRTEQLSSLSGDAVVFGTVQRVIPQGERHDLWTPLGIQFQEAETLGNRKARRRAAALQRKETTPPSDVAAPGAELSVRLEGPAVVIMPIAVFR